MASTTIDTRAYIAVDKSTQLHEGLIKRREVRANDVSIQIHYCGICHTDLHQVRDEWGNAMYPMVPGHEIVGIVTSVGSSVTRFSVGQRVGVGCMVDSCGSCHYCQDGHQQYCVQGATLTYNSKDLISGGQTFGGYSDHIVVDQRFVLSIPPSLDLAEAAPLLCAGITTYYPLHQHKIGTTSKVGVLGIGGLGHLALQLAKAVGAHVVAFTSKISKRDELLSFGADEVIITSNTSDFDKIANSLDLIIDTVSDDHDITPFIASLRTAGVYHVLGASPTPLKVNTAPFLFKQLVFTGSLIGGVELTQEMLNLCADKGVRPKIELGQLKDVNQLFERLEKGDVRYRFVLDIKNAFNN